MAAGWSIRSRLASRSFFTDVRRFTTAARITLRGSPFLNNSRSAALPGSSMSAPTMRMMRSASFSSWARTATPARLPQSLIFAPALSISPWSLSWQPCSPRYQPPPSPSDRSFRYRLQPGTISCPPAPVLTQPEGFQHPVHRQPVRGIAFWIVPQAAPWVIHQPVAPTTG